MTQVSLTTTNLEFVQKWLPGFNRILLIVPPVYDIRFEWARWHQSTGILQVGAWLRTQGKDVRFIDCLQTDKKKVQRHKVGEINIEHQVFNKWHYGITHHALKLKINALRVEGWQPDTVFITTFNSIWWEAARDIISVLKKRLPQAQIVLGGAYPTIELEHAAQNSGADLVVSGSITQAKELAPDLSLYSQVPPTTGIYFYGSRTVFESQGQVSPRNPDSLVAEICAKAKAGVREILFFDEEIRPQDGDTLGEVFDRVADCRLDIRFVFPGNISPYIVTDRLARQMKGARVKQLYLRCDMQWGDDQVQYTANLVDYRRCMDALLHHGGFKPRQDELAAMLVVGLPYEDLKEVSERLIQLAHIVGSVVLVPFQYVPGLHRGALFDSIFTADDSGPPEDYNGKFFPLARRSGKTFEDYMELTRLAALLNSKYRSRTFDFLGGSFAAKLFRTSIRSEAWNPFRGNTEPSDAPELFDLLQIDKGQDE